MAGSCSCSIDPRTRGYLLVALGVCVVTPDAVIVRAATTAGGSFWWIISLKCIFLSVMIFAFTVAQAGAKKTFGSLRAGPLHLLVIAIFNGIVTFCFPVCFQTTTGAKALLLISLNPLWSALLGWKILGDQLPLRTVLALLGAALSILLIFIPPLTFGAAFEDEGGDPPIAVDGVGNWRGDLISVVTGLSLASLITASRYTIQRKPEVVGAVGMAFGGMGAGLVALLLACAFSWDAPANFEPAFWPLIVADAVCVGACTILALTWAPRYISPAEVALVLLLENILGPLWVAVAGYEVPNHWTLAGGAMLILVLGAHQVAQILEARAARGSEARAAAARGDGTTASSTAKKASECSASATEAPPVVAVTVVDRT